MESRTFRNCDAWACQPRTSASNLGLSSAKEPAGTAQSAQSEMPEASRCSRRKAITGRWTSHNTTGKVWWTSTMTVTGRGQGPMSVQPQFTLPEILGKIRSAFGSSGRHFPGFHLRHNMPFTLQTTLTTTITGVLSFFIERPLVAMAIYPKNRVTIPLNDVCYPST